MSASTGCFWFALAALGIGGIAFEVTFYKVSNSLLRRRSLTVDAGSALRTNCDVSICPPSGARRGRAPLLPEHVGTRSHTTRGVDRLRCNSFRSRFLHCSQVTGCACTFPTCLDECRAGFSFQTIRTISSSNIRTPSRKRPGPPARLLISHNDSEDEQGLPTTYNPQIGVVCEPRT